MTREHTEDFEKVYMENFSYVYNFIYMKVLNTHTAEDICSTTFLKAYEKFESFDPSMSSVRTWLCVIARNTLIDHVKSGFVKNNQLTDEFPDVPVGEDTEELVMKKAVLKEVSRLLKELSDEEKDLISMRYALGLQVKEIAGILGISPNSCVHRISRILEKCRKMEEAAGNQLSDFV